MKAKKERILIIKQLISNKKISNQEELLDLLRVAGFEYTQATLSRDLKAIRVGKMADPEKGNIYVLHEQISNNDSKPTPTMPAETILSIEFSFNFGILKTLPGFASSIAIYIDSSNSIELAGTIAGDDTILILPRENFSRREILNALEEIFPGIEEKTV